jgi:hypothetical protein
MNSGRTQAGFSAALAAILILTSSGHGQEISCCSGGATSQLVLSEVNFHEVSISNVLQYLCEETEKEHGVKLRMDFDFSPPVVSVSLPSGLDDETQRFLQQLSRRVEDRAAASAASSQVWAEHKITLSLRSVPVCDALAYTLVLSGEPVTCLTNKPTFTIGYRPWQMAARVYKIRPEACKELEPFYRAAGEQNGTTGYRFFPSPAGVVAPVYTCLADRGLLMAIGYGSELESLERTLKEHGWLETANQR